MSKLHFQKKINVDISSSPIFLPDIGTFFNKDIELAKELIYDLYQGGAEIIKGEILHDSDIVLKNEKFIETYLNKDGTIEVDEVRKIIERKTIRLCDYEILLNYCSSLDLPFALSVYDKVGAEFAYEMKASVLKVASSNIVHKPLIELVSKFNLPIIIDTGKSTLEEVARAINWAQDAGAKNIIIEHSPSAPPAPITDQNLLTIPLFREIYGFPVGLSDHYEGEEMLYAAVALGASVLEKGIIPVSAGNDQDVYHALTVDKFKKVNQKCKAIHIALGQKMRYMSRSSDKHLYRMGLTAMEDLVVGDRLSDKTVKFRIPCSNGIKIEHWELVEGWQVSENIQAGMPIRWRDVKFSDT